jgi:hypothetical protein
MADYQAEARRAAQRYGLDPNVFVRQIRQESGFNPNARSPAGAIGIAQIMPATARGWGVNPNDPVASLNAAAKNMARYVKQYGSYKNALVAYNAGPGRVGKSLPAETRNYVSTILGGRDPGGLSASRRTSGSGGSQASPSTSGGSTRTITETTPGVDNRLARLSLVQSFLDDHSANPVDFALQARGLQDVAPTSTTRTIRTPGTPGSPATPAGSSPSGGSAGSFGKSHSPLLELIHKGDRPYAVKNGKTVSPSFYSAVWDGHANHVHVAAGPKTIVQLGRLAQKMGLHVGENPHFGGVAPVHAPHSYHYRGEAIDVSGDPRKMNAYARRVDQLYGVGGR